MTNEPRLPIEIAKHLADERAPRHPGCGGRGYYRSFDTDYDCGGCPSCNWAERLGYVIADAAKLTAGAALRARYETAIVAYDALRLIGRAVASALAPGAAVQRFLIGVVAEWNTVRKGRWYQVDGKRGNAKKVHGKIGLCVGVYAEERRSQYNTWSYGTTTKAALKIADPDRKFIDGREKLVYVTIGNLEPVTEPAHESVARLERDAVQVRRLIGRPAFPAHLAGGRGAIGCIVAGPHTGKAGKVFWYAEKKKDDPRVGVRLCTCKKRCTCEVAWCSARDVVPAKPVPAPTAVAVNGDLVEISCAEVAEQQALALGQAGFEDEARAWYVAGKETRA